MFAVSASILFERFLCSENDLRNLIQQSKRPIKINALILISVGHVGHKLIVFITVQRIIPQDLKCLLNPFTNGQACDALAPAPCPILFQRLANAGHKRFSMRFNFVMKSRFCVKVISN